MFGSANALQRTDLKTGATGKHQHHGVHSNGESYRTGANLRQVLLRHSFVSETERAFWRATNQQHICVVDRAYAMTSAGGFALGPFLALG